MTSLEDLGQWFNQIELKYSDRIIKEKIDKIDNMLNNDKDTKEDV